LNQRALKGYFIALEFIRKRSLGIVSKLKKKGGEIGNV